VIIPDSVTELGKNAFRDCTALTTVVIGSGVHKIEDDAFNGCTHLEAIVIASSNTISIGNNITWDVNSDVKIIKTGDYTGKLNTNATNELNIIPHKKYYNTNGCICKTNNYICNHVKQQYISSC